MVRPSRSSRLGRSRPPTPHVIDTAHSPINVLADSRVSDDSKGNPIHDHVTVRWDFVVQDPAAGK